MQEMLFGKGINWNDYPNWFKRGSAIVYEPGIDPLDSYWRADSLTPIFTADRNYLTSRVPRQWAEDAEGRQVTNSQCQDYGPQAEM
jgi:tRNA(His) 5'-end guanylyltransferase